MAKAMRGIIICVSAAILLSVAHAEQLDPAIPRDKCGVSVISDEAENTVLFIRGSDKAFHIYTQPANNDEPNSANWVSLGGSFTGGPAVVRSNDGRLEVFGRGLDNFIWHKYQSAPNSDTWTTWMHLGDKHKFISDPVPVLGSEGFIHLFARAADNSLMHKTQFTNSTLFVWTEWTSLGGSLTSQPAVMLDSEGLIHVFVRGPDRALWHKYQTGGQAPRFVKWSDWQSLGGVLASAPRVPVALNTVNLLEIFVRASDKAYWHRCQVASLPSTEREVDWNEWQSLGGVFSSGPAAIVNNDGLIEAFGRGADKAIWWKTQYLVDGVPKWSNWNSIKGLTSTGPAVHIHSDSALAVYVRGVDKQIWVKKQVLGFNNSTSPFGVWKPFKNQDSLQNEDILAEAFAC